MRTTTAFSPTAAYTVVPSRPGSKLFEISPGPPRHERLRWRLMGAMLAAGMQPVDVTVQRGYGDPFQTEFDRSVADLTFRCPCRGEQIRERWPIRPGRTSEETDDRLVLDVVHGLADHIREDIKKGLI